MFFLTANPELMRSTWKRAEKLAAKNASVSTAHELYVFHENMKLMLWEKPESTDDFLHNIFVLQYVAERIEKFSLSNMLATDESVASILYWWYTNMPYHANPYELNAQKLWEHDAKVQSAMAERTISSC